MKTNSWIITWIKIIFIIVLIIISFYIICFGFEYTNSKITNVFNKSQKIIKYEDFKRTYPSKTTKPIYIFYHICTQNEWKDIVEEQMKTIIDSGLYEKATKIYYGCNCSLCDVELDEFFRPYDKATPSILSPDTKTYENLTMNEMIQFSKNNPDSYILYIHTKGTTKRSISQIGWRNYMMYWLVDRHQIAIDSLDRGFHTVGTFYINNRFINLMNIPIHYSGNFFWSTGEYLCRVPFIEKVEDRYHAEFTLLKSYETGKHININNKSYLSPYSLGLYVFSPSIDSNSNPDLVIF